MVCLCVGRVQLSILLSLSVFYPGFKVIPRWCCVCVDFLNELENCDGLGEREEKEKEGGGEGVRRRREGEREREDRAGADEQEADYTPEQKEAVDR